jgi:hypothetical protein
VRTQSESSDTYPHVVAVLDAKHRVIECAAHIQWIIQVRRREGLHPWQGVSFCRTKEALVRLAGPHPLLLALPDRFLERRETAREAVEEQKSQPARPCATSDAETRPSAAPVLAEAL